MRRIVSRLIGVPGNGGLEEPYRGDGTGRPANIPLPPARLPLFRAGRIRKQWRYVGVWSPERLLCAASVAVGPFRQEFWALWDRGERRLRERTRLRSARVQVHSGRVQVREPDLIIDLSLEENEGVQVITPSGGAYTWTRKRLAPAHGMLRIGEREEVVEGMAILDESAGYHPRHTVWRWCSGAGRSTDGRAVGWNLVVGLNDSPHNSERTLWVEGEPVEVGPVHFASDLTSVTFEGGETLRFTAEAVRRREDNLLLIRSAYAQPFGIFEGALPGGLDVAEGYGVMEWHEAYW